LDYYLPYGRRMLKFCELCPRGLDGLGMLTFGPLLESVERPI
jgi:hypothetical protein